MAGLDQAGPIWLDVTRLLSRAGRGVLTGIDRVELAYLQHLLILGDPATRYLARTTRGYLLLDNRGGARLAGIIGGEVRPDRADLLSRSLGKGSNTRHRVEASVRPFAVDRGLPRGLMRMIDRRAPGPMTYLNIGHSNLSQATLGAFGRSRWARTAVLIHDLIPITHPDLVAEGMPARFAGRLERVRTHADLVICNSAATEADLAVHWGDGPRPASVVAHLGLDQRPRASTARDPRHFVMLGTIEPRKNHALILDVWERLADDLPDALMPVLHIIGPTGWRVEDLMARLSVHPLLGRSIHLHGALPEAEMQAHLARATALLFPSLAEGYGYPPLEAALAGAVPICSDLPVFAETLGKSAVYLNARDAYPWVETIKKHVLGTEVLQTRPMPRASGWQLHFSKVGAALATQRAEGR
jgi:glycosyltransferase involved in cell wall biosynthesis